jgi:hypothetical protein
MALEVFPHDHIGPAGCGQQRVIIQVQHPRQLAEDMKRRDAMVDSIKRYWGLIGLPSSLLT